MAQTQTDKAHTRTSLNPMRLRNPHTLLKVGTTNSPSKWEHSGMDPRSICKLALAGTNCSRVSAKVWEHFGMEPGSICKLAPAGTNCLEESCKLGTFWDGTALLHFLYTPPKPSKLI